MSDRVVLLGPTASGKSRVAMEVARAVSGTEIVSIDALCVYRGMDIGTAKPSNDETAEVVHHMIDLLEPTEECTVALFQREARRVLEEIDGRGVPSLLVGGTGLYVRAVVDNLDVPGRWPEIREGLEADPDTAGLHRRLSELDPIAAGRMEPTNRRRVVRALEVCVGSGRPFSSFGPGLESYSPATWPMFGLRLPRALLDVRIAERFDQQLSAGLLEEVRSLCSGTRELSRTARQALGYRELIDHIEGRSTLEEAVDSAVARIRKFARRQERWFRRDPRIEWIDLPDGDLSPAVGRLLEVLG